MNQNKALNGISIVITYFNEQTELQQCLSALIESWKLLDITKQQCIQIIIVDDASDLPPKNWPIRPKIELVRQPTNQGVGHARNRGAKLSTYTYVQFLDSDVIVGSTFLGRLFDTLRTNHEVTIVQGHYAKEPANQPASSWMRASTRCRAGSTKSYAISLSMT